MNLKSWKIALMVVIGIVALLGTVGGATALQLAPFVGYYVLAALDLTGKKINIYMVILSLLMAITNFFPFSIIDVALWLAVLVTYAKE